MIESNWITKPKVIFYSIATLAIGIIIGGYLFSDTQPRSFLSLHSCKETCLKPNELVGLLASVGIQKFDSLVPVMVLETDKSVVLKHPFPQAPVHYLILPKKDIKDIGEISFEDKEYILDMVTTLSEVIRKEGLKNYKVVSNGPDIQLMTYLHFHLMGYK